MLAQLGPKRALDQRLFQLFEQPVLSGQVLRLRVVRKQFVQKFGGNRRISRHVSLPLKVNSQKPTYTLFLTPSVVVLQRPCGTLAVSLVPQSDHPRSGAMLVLVQVSSMKTKRSGSMRP